MSHRNFILNKPYGYISQFHSNQRYANKKKYLGELFNFPEGTMAIGRLDEASEGLLLLTTDGMQSEIVRSRNIEKEYWAQVDGLAEQKEIESLLGGVSIVVEGKEHIARALKAELMSTPSFLPVRARRIRDERHGPTSWIRMVLNEGKFRQVRKMTAAVGLPTLRLIRGRIGNINLNEMAAGSCLEVEKFDLG